MGAQVAFTAILSGKQGVVARAVVGLPGLASDPQFATFPSFTQANEFAQRLNEGLGLTPSQARTIVIDVMVKAQALVSECDCLVQMARELRLRSRHRYRHPELEWVLTVFRSWCDVLQHRLHTPRREERAAYSKCKEGAF